MNHLILDDDTNVSTAFATISHNYLFIYLGSNVNGLSHGKTYVPSWVQSQWW